MPGERVKQATLYRSDCHYFSFSNDGRSLSVSGAYIGNISRLTPVGDVVTNISDPTNFEARLRDILEYWETTIRFPVPYEPVSHLSILGFKDAILQDFGMWANSLWGCQKPLQQIYFNY
jgi:hypothetical protein